MAIIVGIIILATSLFIAYKLSIGQSPKKKYIIWGLTTMFAITPLFSWLVSILFAVSVGDGFAAVALMMLLLPLFFVIGLSMLLIGIFRKEKTESI
ncbi:MAG TPA: hypothetical protein VEV44_15000 [Pseudoneobacillus sp.]|nr:hypothetical protein [Pseudoneobacillus sp.]